MRVVDSNDFRPVRFTGGDSYRPVIKKDGLGFSVCKTVIPVGGPYEWQYKNHQEVCYCIQGYGVLTNLETGERYNITPDKVYIQDKHELHSFEAMTEVVLISIFNPPLKGTEKHDKYGNYGI